MKIRNIVGRYTIFIIIAVLSITVAGCTSSTPQLVEVTRIVPQTVFVTQIVERVITATPIPPTPTPEPTPTPQQTPTPSYLIWSSPQVVEVFKVAGLEVEGTYTMTKDDYGFAPLVAIEGTRFLIPSLCSDCGGRIMSFVSLEDLEKVREYYVSLGESSAFLFSWTFAWDNILVQINGDLPEQQAQQYEIALNTME